MSMERTDRMERDRDGGGRGGRDGGMDDERGGRGAPRRKVCRFCADKAAVVDYKDPGSLKLFLTERGKVIPRRISGNCAAHQRRVTEAIRRARSVALLPFTVAG
ncbi:MAG: 30S ribosomal protein S18 [Deltaproteobacteria bacterium]|nr:30S ribosomal protein S18 [Deltaproteobacteria bacterium]